VLICDEHANDVELDDGVFMSMDYNMINMLLVVCVLNLYMLNVDVDCGYCMYNIDDDLCEHMHCWWVICPCIICWVEYSYPYWRWRILWIQLLTTIIDDDYDIFVASWGDDLGNDWYHMHIEVVSRLIAWFDMSHNCLCAWWLLWLMIFILDELHTYELRNFSGL